MARLYTNENFPFPAVEELRRLGHNVLTTLEAGKSGNAIPDEAVLQFACADNRAIVTLNRKHFIRLHEQYPEHFGIIVCSFDPDFVSLAERINTSINDQSPLSGKLIRVNRPG